MAVTALILLTVLGRGCHERSESRAVGLAHCQSFGGWDSSGLIYGAEIPRFGLGLSGALPDVRPLAVCSPEGKSCPTIGQLSPGALGHQRFWIPQLEIQTPLLRWGPLWAGPDFAFAVHPGWSQSRVTSLGTTKLETPQAYLFGLATGVDLRVRRVALHSELVVGESSFSVSATTSRPLDIGDDGFSLQVRGGLEVWLTPALAIGASAGVDLLRTDRVTLGLFVMVPTRAPFSGVDSLL